MDERVGAQVARGDCMGGRFQTSPFYHVFIAKKKGCLGFVAVVSNHALS